MDRQVSAPEAVSQATGPRSPALVPAFGIQRGRVVDLSEDTHPVLRDAAGDEVDVFDVADELFQKYGRALLVDLDGTRRNRPQLEFVGEIGRQKELWVEAGARRAEDVMDILVAGASRAVLSTAQVLDRREISRALRLSSAVMLEIISDRGSVVSPDPQLAQAPLADLAREGMSRGAAGIILSSPGAHVDWSLVQRLSPEVPLYVGRPFQLREARNLSQAGAEGGIFLLGDG
jgi:phosphoribosylformimino-5-aminoimidazole carboxamide ribonucleotide (ProFAR) isomerase